MVCVFGLFEDIDHFIYFCLMLSMKTKYGIKALVYLYKHDSSAPISISDISEAKNIPRKFLETILVNLKKGGILGSKKGKYGGYYLRKDPHAIFLSEIFRLLNGPIAMIPCTSLNFYEKCDDCVDEEACRVNRLMIEVRDSMLSILEHKNLVELVEQNISID